MSLKHDSTSQPPAEAEPPWLPALNVFYDSPSRDRQKRHVGGWAPILIPFQEAADYLNISLKTFARHVKQLETIEGRKPCPLSTTEQNGNVYYLIPAIGGKAGNSKRNEFFFYSFSYVHERDASGQKKTKTRLWYCTLETIWVVGLRLDNPRGDHLRHMFYNKTMRKPYYDLQNNLQEPSSAVPSKNY